MDEDIRSQIRELQTRWQIPAMSVAIVGPDRQMWSEGFGVANIENDVTATPATVYRLASISKPITATAVMQLAERGLLDIDAPIQEYLPTFPKKPWPITTRQLLSHMAGFRDVTDAESRNSTRYPYGTVPTEIFLDAFKNDDLLHEPGTKFRYTSHGYNLLGSIIEAVSESSYLTFVCENIFKPAEMHSTFADDTQAIIPHRARGYAWNEDKSAIVNAAFTDVSNRLPAGGFCATVEDVVRFGRALQSGRLVTPPTLDQIFTLQKIDTGQDTRFGLAWFLSSRNGEVEAAHGGKSHGTSTMLYLRATSGIVVGILTNLQDVPAPAKHALARRLADLVMG